MKNVITIVVATVLFIALSVFAWRSWNDAKDWKSLYDQQVGMTDKAEDSYNKAKVIITDRELKIETLDKKLKEAMGRKPVKEVVYITVQADASGGGQAVTESETIYKFRDFRLAATLDTETKDFDYALTQKFRVGLFELEGNDYRAELVELNGSEVVTSHAIHDFVVYKRKEGSRKFQLGTNLQLGAWGGISLPVIAGMWSPFVSLNFMSYGASHLDSDWRFLSLGVNMKGGQIEPISYRLSNHIPLLSDLFVTLPVSVTWDGRVVIGLGLSSTL